MFWKKIVKREESERDGSESERERASGHGLTTFRKVFYSLSLFLFLCNYSKPTHLHAPTRSQSHTRTHTHAHTPHTDTKQTSVGNVGGDRGEGEGVKSMCVTRIGVMKDCCGEEKEGWEVVRYSASGVFSGACDWRCVCVCVCVCVVFWNTDEEYDVFLCLLHHFFSAFPSFSRKAL